MLKAAACPIVFLAVEQYVRQGKTVFQLVRPLLNQIRRQDNQLPVFALIPHLRGDNQRLISLAE